MQSYLSKEPGLGTELIPRQVLGSVHGRDTRAQKIFQKYILKTFLKVEKYSRKLIFPKLNKFYKLRVNILHMFVNVLLLLYKIDIICFTYC